LSEVIVRKPKPPLTDQEKYQVILKYSEGVPVTQIASEVSRDIGIINKLISKTHNGMTAVKETNALLQATHKGAVTQYYGKNPSKFITTAFLAEIDTLAEIYAYYFAQTGDNRFALIQSGMDMGIPKNMRKNTKDYVYKIRGQFLRDIPQVKDIIKLVHDKRIKEYHIEKPQIQMELVAQIEELKEAVKDDPKQRVNLLRAVEMLGRTIGSFTDRVQVEEVDAKSGLEILMERAKGEAKLTYVPEEEHGEEDSEAEAPGDCPDILQ